MEIVPLTPRSYADWNGFCEQSSEAWFWHTTDWLDYNLGYRPERKPRLLSFLCKEGKRVLAAVPLILEEHEQFGRVWRFFTMGGNPLAAPALSDALSEAQRENLLDVIFQTIDELAAELDVAYARYRLFPLARRRLEPKYAPANFLLKYGYLDCTTNTQLIDLRLSERALLEGVRRNHQRSIEKARSLFRIRFHQGAELPLEKIDEYRLLHAKDAGRVTRPKATFDLMGEWMRRGRGFMTEAYTPEGRSVGFELYAIFQKAAYGLSVCNEPELEHWPIRHLVEWESIRHMRSLGVEFYDIGMQHYSALPYDFPEKKNSDISLFKRGFGGVEVPSFCGERFFDREYWSALREERTRKFGERYGWTRPSDRSRGKALLDSAAKAESGQDDAAARAAPEEPKPPSLELLATITAVIADNQPAVGDYRNGRAGALNFLVGAVLRTKQGSDPQIVRRALEDRLSRGD